MKVFMFMYKSGFIERIWFKYVETPPHSLVSYHYCSSRDMAMAALSISSSSSSSSLSSSTSGAEKRFSFCIIWKLESYCLIIVWHFEKLLCFWSSPAAWSLEELNSLSPSHPHHHHQLHEVASSEKLKVIVWLESRWFLLLPSFQAHLAWWSRALPLHLCITIPLLIPGTSPDKASSTPTWYSSSNWNVPLLIPSWVWVTWKVESLCTFVTIHLFWVFFARLWWKRAPPPPLPVPGTWQWPFSTSPPPRLHLKNWVSNKLFGYILESCFKSDK